MLTGSRLQLQGELQSKSEAVKKYRGVFHGVKVILQNEGPRGLFRGIGSAVRGGGGFFFPAEVGDKRTGWMKKADCQVTDLKVYLPGLAQRVPPGVLRAFAQGLHDRHLQGLDRPVTRRQCLLRRSVGYHRRGHCLAFLSCEDPSAVILSVSPSGHAAQLSRVLRWP